MDAERDEDDETEPETFEVSVRNTFEAEDAESAVKQMVEWLQENAGQVGYMVGREGSSAIEFIDAEDVM